MLISTALNGFFLSKQADGRVPATILNYRWTLGSMQTYLNDKQVEEITPDDLRRFFAWLQSDDYKPPRREKTRPLTNRTIEGFWVATRSFFTWAMTELELPDRPDKHLKRPRYVDPDVVAFTDEEIKALLKACEYSKWVAREDMVPYRYARATMLRDQAMIHVLLSIGLRASELCRLRLKDLQEDTGEVTILPHRTSLKSRPRHLLMGKAARKAVWRYLADRREHEGELRPDDFLFAARGGKPFDKDTLQQLMRRIGKRASVSDVHPHRFRHTCALLRLRNGLDPFSLSVLLGHSDMTMTKRYVNLTRADLATGLANSDPVDRWRL